MQARLEQDGWPRTEVSHNDLGRQELRITGILSYGNAHVNLNYHYHLFFLCLQEKKKISCFWSFSSHMLKKITIPSTIWSYNTTRGEKTKLGQ